MLYEINPKKHCSLCQLTTEQESFFIGFAFLRRRENKTDKRLKWDDAFPEIEVECLYHTTSEASEASLAPQASHQPPKAASVRVICNETFLDIFKHCDFCIAIQISILPPDIIDQFNSWTFKLFQF